MGNFGRFGSPLGLSIFRGKALSFLHHLLAISIHLPLFIGKIRLGSLSRGRGGGLGLDGLLGCVLV